MSYSESTNSHRGTGTGQSSSETRYIPEEQRQEEYENSMLGQLGLNPSFLTGYQSEFVNSAAFRSAYNLFSSGPNPELWLPRLAALVNSIVHSRDNQDLNIIEGIINIVAGDQEGSALLQTAYTNLNNLVAEYNQWFNSLPVNQRLQFSDAGINVALDGGSAITGSSMSAGTAQVSESVSAANQAFDNSIGFIRDVSNGFLNSINFIRDSFFKGAELDLSKKRIEFDLNSKLQDINMQRLSMGLEPITSLSDIKDDSKSEFFSIIKKRQNKESLSLDVETSKQEEYNKEFFKCYSDVCTSVAQIKIANEFLEASTSAQNAQLSFKTSKYQNEVADSLDPNSGKAIQSLQYDYDKSRLQAEKMNEDLKNILQGYKANVFSTWIQKAKSGTDAEKVIYSNLLMNVGLDSFDADSKFLMAIGESGVIDAFNDFKNGDGLFSEFLRTLSR